MRTKRKYCKNNRIIPLSSLLLVAFVFFLSIGFSAYQMILEVEDINAIVRLERDVRVTGFGVLDSASGATSSWEEYNVQSVLSNLSLPNQDSTISYQVEITNIGNVEVGIFAITGLPSSLYYSIDQNNYVIGDILCDSSNSNKCKLGSVSRLNITIGYKENGYDSENTSFNINLNFDFRQIYEISYDGFSSTSGLPKYIMENETKTITFNNNTYIPGA